MLVVFSAALLPCGLFAVALFASVERRRKKHEVDALANKEKEKMRL